MVLTEIKCKLHAALTKWPINQFKAVQQTRLQLLKAYCSNLKTVLTLLLQLLLRSAITGANSSVELSYVFNYEL